MTTARTLSGPGEEYYRQNYRSYDRQNPDYKLAYYRSRIEQHRDRALPRCLYDIGCGPGNFLASLEPGWTAFGSDINSFAVERARAKVADGRFALGAGAVSQLFDEAFPVITAFDVLEHVPEIEAAGRTIGDQLLPGGLFLFVVPVYDGLSGPVIRLLDRDPTHVHKRERGFWLDWASRHFRLLSWEGVTRYLLPGGYYLHHVTSSMRNHTPAICVACRSAR
jgi:SAM-dependent methyltransferase